MLNSPYTSGTLTASSLPSLLATVSSTSYASQQTMINPQVGSQIQQPYGGVYAPQTMVVPQAMYGGMAPAASVGYPSGMNGIPVAGQLYYQPGRIITGYSQALYRAYIPPSISVLPAYSVQQPGVAPTVYGGSGWV
jgi:hypothetical protein